MLERILHWLDQLLGRDVDKTNAQLDRLVAALLDLIQDLQKANDASVEATERAARIQGRIRELTA